MYPNSLIQKLIENYLSGGENEHYEFIEKTNARYKIYAREYTEMLSTILQLDIHRPDGGLFLFPKLKSDRPLDFDKLLEKYHVAVAPGAAFGSACEKSFSNIYGC